MNDMKHYARDLQREQRKQGWLIVIVFLLAGTAEPLADLVCKLLG
jgi:hypothetical protein